MVAVVVAAAGVVVVAVSLMFPFLYSKAQEGYSQQKI